MSHEYWSTHNDLHGQNHLVRSTYEPGLSIQSDQDSLVPVITDEGKPVIPLSSSVCRLRQIPEAGLSQNRNTTQSAGSDGDEFTTFSTPIGDDDSQSASPKIEALGTTQYTVDEPESSKGDEDIEMDAALELAKKALSLVPGNPTSPVNEHEVVTAVAQAIDVQTALYHKQAIEIQRLRDMLRSPGEN